MGADKKGREQVTKKKKTQKTDENCSQNEKIEFFMIIFTKIHKNIIEISRCLLYNKSDIGTGGTRFEKG